MVMVWVAVRSWVRIAWNREIWGLELKFSFGVIFRVESIQSWRRGNYAVSLIFWVRGLSPPIWKCAWKPVTRVDLTERIWVDVMIIERLVIRAVDTLIVTETETTEQIWFVQPKKNMEVIYETWMMIRFLSNKYGQFRRLKASIFW